jgi:hypothetical protein
LFFLFPFGQLLIYAVQLQLERHNVPFDQHRLEAMVDAVKAWGIKPGEDFELRFDRMNDPRSLRFLPRWPVENIRRGKEGGDVWVSRDPNGKLTVIIETKDLGHAGQFGYAYSEIPPQKAGKDESLEFGENSNLRCTNAGWKVAANWWEVVNCE